MNQSSTLSESVSHDTDAQRPKLRVGLMLDGLTVPNWVHRIVQEIQQSDYAHVELVIVNAAPASETPVHGIVARLRDMYKRGLYNRYHNWDYQRCRENDDLDALAPRDVSGLVDRDSCINVTPIQKKFTDRFETSDVERIKQSELDVVIRFGFRIIRGDILDVAKYGVWSYHHGDNREYRGGPALFWEIFERNPVSGIVLQILSSKLDGGQVIYRSTARTELNSLYANRNPIFWKGAAFVPRRLRDLHRYGWEFLTSLETFSENVPYEKGIYRTPNSPRMLGFLIRRFGRGIQNQIRKRLFKDPDHQWFCAIRKRGATQWNKIDCPRDRFYADPFLFEHNERTWLFIEEFPYHTDKGVLSVCEVNDDATLGPFQVVMDVDVHLSYPSVFAHDGEIYMTPETYDARQVRLYRATRFPFEWELDTVLLDNVDAVDPTIFKRDGKFYLFTNIPAENSSFDDELQLYVADDLRGPWSPHPWNPIVSDVTRSRPAGQLYEENGELIRPAQDCSVRYGYAITLNRITKLSATEYVEQPVRKIMPDWTPRGQATHTTNMTDKFEVRDGQVPLRRWRWEK